MSSMQRVCPLAGGLTRLSTPCFPTFTIFKTPSIFLALHLLHGKSAIRKKLRMPPKQVTLGKFFTTMGQVPLEQAPLEQAKLTLGPGSKTGKARGTSRKDKSKGVSVRTKVESDGEDVEMQEASAAAEVLEEEERLSRDATEEENPKTGRKRGRSPSETKSVKLPSKQTGTKQDAAKEVAEAEQPVLKKRGLVNDRRKQALSASFVPEPEPERAKEKKPRRKASPTQPELEAVKPSRRLGRPPKTAEVAEGTQKVKLEEKPGTSEDTYEEPRKRTSSSESEPEAVKPLRQRGRKPKTGGVAQDIQKVKLSEEKPKASGDTHMEPRKGASSSEPEPEAVKPPRRRGKKPKTEDVAEDMQKVKLSEEKTKTSKKENLRPLKVVSPTRRSKAAATATVTGEPTAGKEVKRESDAEVFSSESESSLKKPEITLAARKKVQATLSSSEHPYRDWLVGSPVPYAAVCKSFALIEGTTKRLEKLSHSSLLLRQVLRLTPDELLLVVHLMCNKLAAEFEGIELGIGESLLMKAIAESCGRTTDKIRAQLIKIGDLGVVAQQSRSNQSTLTFTRPKPLTVAGVHAAFLKIATTAGNGAQQAKVDLIKKLLANATKEGDEAKYIVRALEGKMRLGLADRTIEVALSQAVITWEQEKSDKKPSLSQLQEAEEIMKGVYSELPSFEVIIPALIEHGISNLRNFCQMQPGVPLKPMLAKPTKSITEVLDKFENKTFTCEYKYDGERSQIHFVSRNSTIDYPKAAIDTKQTEKGVAKIFSRNSEDLSKKYPDILGVLDTWIKPGVESFILDCETVGWDKEEKKVLPFQQLMTRKRKDVIVDDVKVRVCVFAFDLLFLNGKPLVKESLQERRRLMYESFNEIEGQFSFAKAMDGNDLEQIQIFLDQSIKDSCEGLMVKMLLGPESGYEPSVRSINWLKVKKDYLVGLGDSLDLVVVGAYFGHGKRTSVYGAFLLACYNNSKETYETICKIGTGFSEQVLEENYKVLTEHVIERPKPYYSHSTGNKDAPDVWFEPKLVWEVKTADMTLSPKYRAAEGLVDPNKGISLRFPRFLRIRDDKTPEQATTSRQLSEMYRRQEAVSGGKKGVDDDFEY